MRSPTRRRSRQRGSAMMITLIIVAAMLAGGAVLASMQMSSNRSTEITRSGMTALYCAEAGLSAARPLISSNYTQWAAALAAPTVEPPWLNTMDRDLDNDGSDDFMITLRDNDDELAPAPNDLTRDNDLRVFIVSTCTKFPDTPKQVVELVFFNAFGTCYDSQEGGCGGNYNATKN